MNKLATLMLAAVLLAPAPGTGFRTSDTTRKTAKAEPRAQVTASSASMPYLTEGPDPSLDSNIAPPLVVLLLGSALLLAWHPAPRGDGSAGRLDPRMGGRRGDYVPRSSRE